MVRWFSPAHEFRDELVDGDVDHQAGRGPDDEPIHTGDRVTKTYRAMKYPHDGHGVAEETRNAFSRLPVT